jgi:ubiquinone/menaquinone biosynthesis C-methylase UbiE
MVVDRSRRRCLLCDASFTGRAFVCRECADRYRDAPIPDEVLRRFYQEVDIEYPEWANTFGNYNPPRAMIRYLDRLDRDLKILEIGAGGGFLLEDLWQRGFRDLTGSDITVTSMVEMSRKAIALSVVAANAESLPFVDESFDIVLSSDVIEHLTRVDAHLSEVSRILRPGGRYLLKTPNRRPAELYYRVRGLYDHHIWHPSMFSAAELRHAMMSHGLSVEHLPVEALTAAQLRKIPVSPVRKLARTFPINRLPVWMQPHMEIVATRI